MVTIVGAFLSADAANAFAASPKLNGAMENGAVIGKPDIKVLTVHGLTRIRGEEILHMTRA